MSSVQRLSHDTIEDKNRIAEIECEIKHLMLMQKDCIIDDTNAAMIIDDLRKKEFKLKEEKVLRVHSNRITAVNIEIKGKTVSRWQTQCGSSRPRCSSYEALIEKLYEFYFDKRVISDFSFKSIFEAALDEKVLTECPKEKTIRDYHDTYKAWIDDSFGSKDIRLIKPSELNAYMLRKVRELRPKKKYFYRFKGLLNLVFDFASGKEQRIIDYNPVPTSNASFAKFFTITSTRPEDKAFQPAEVDLIRDHLWHRVHERKYDVYGFAILFASETGVREGEIPSLKWSDIKGNAVHIHSQQNDEKRNGKRIFYYNAATKNEKGVSRDGRYIPLTDLIRDILSELKAQQDALNIKSEWVFCREDGTWITTVSYYNALYRVCTKLDLRLTNNHAFRMALNSYKYVPMGLPASERARILGHSVETNLRHYTFARADDYIDELCDKINAYDDQTRKNSAESEGGTWGYPNILPFKAKEKSQESLGNTGFLQKTLKS